MGATGVGMCQNSSKQLGGFVSSVRKAYVEADTLELFRYQL